MTKVLINELSEKAHRSLCYSNFHNALDCYKQILLLNPNNDVALHFLAFISNTQGKYEKALDLAKKAIEQYSCCATYYVTLANIYRNLNNYPEAVNTIRIACELRPYDAMMLSNAAMLLAEERKFDRARDVYEAALEFEPENAFVHFNYSLLLLSNGFFEQGWQEYEWRMPLYYNIPIFKYDNIKDKKIRIIPEQGYGDFLMFSRYFDSLKQSGATLFITCPKALANLYDCHYCPDPHMSIHIGSLPIFFREIPINPYVKAPGFIKTNKKGFKVGIASQSKKPYNDNIQSFPRSDGSVFLTQHPKTLAYLSSIKRSLPLNFFDFIGDFDIKFYNLEKNTILDNMENVLVSDFADLADWVDQMDLIITIDTALAHLAGAMGKETWLLLPYDAEWRWQTEREDSYWYPSVKIIRQSSRGDWNSVKKQVIDKLVHS